MNATLIRCALALLVLAATDAHAARWQITRDGALLPAPPSLLKSQAFCQANPGTLLVFQDSLVTTPASGRVSEDVGSVGLRADVTVEAVCTTGPVTLRLRYGALPGSTAGECCDYLPFQLQAVSPALPTFGPVTSFNASTNFVIVDDEIEEEEEQLLVGLLGGEVLGPLNVIDIPGSSTPLATFVIEDDDGLDLSQEGVTTTVTTALGAAPDPIAAAAITPLAENCSTATDPAILEQCAAIIALAEANQAQALTQVLQAISGEELSAQITSSIDGANQRGAQIDGRIAALRGGATGVSLDEVAFNYRGQTLSGGMLFNALAGEQGGGGEDFGGGLLDQRLGAFLNVTVLGGKRDASDFEVGFDFDGYSALGGLDWRFSDTFIAGAAVGWSDLSSDLDDDGGGLDSTGWSLTGYGTWLVGERGYVDFTVGRLWNDYDQTRVVDLGLLGAGFGRSVAVGTTDAEQTSFGLGGGIDIALGEWVYSPRGSLLRTRSKIDGFTESGAGINDLIFADQDFDSLLWTFSQSISRSYSISSGAIQPYFALDLSRETRNEAFVITPTLRVRPDQRSTPVFIDESDRSFGRGDVGLSFIGSGGFQWFASYSRLLGYDKVSAWAVRAGLRWEF